jgi:hypothetical protein
MFSNDRLHMIGKGIVKGSGVFIFRIAGDMIADRHLNDDTSILLQRFWTALCDKLSERFVAIVQINGALGVVRNMDILR